MPVTISAQQNRGQCSDVQQVTVSGAELSELRVLVRSALIGRDAQAEDGLGEILHNLKARTQGQGVSDININTTAVRIWIDRNPDLYDQLAKFKLQARVGQCVQSAVFCAMTQGVRPASPDVYESLFELVAKLNSSTLTSLTYYIYDKPNAMCGSFRMHHGALAFDLPLECPTR